MKNKRLEVLIAQSYDRLSRGSKRLAEFCTTNPEEVPMLSAAELGERVGVSASTVVRFAQVLGYEGFSELQRAFRSEALRGIMRDKDTQERISIAKEYVGPDSDQHLLEQIFADEARHLKLTLDHVRSEAFDATVRTLVDAKQIYVIGLRGSAPLASALTIGLRYARPHVHLLSLGFADLPDQLASIEKGDACVAISHTPYVQESVRCLEFAKSQEAATIAITDQRLAPAARAADHVLLTYNPMWFSLCTAGVVALINALVFGVASKTPHDGKSNARKVTEWLPHFVTFMAGEHGGAAHGAGRLFQNLGDGSLEE